MTVDQNIECMRNAAPNSSVRLFRQCLITAMITLIRRHSLRIRVMAKGLRIDGARLAMSCRLLSIAQRRISTSICDYR